MEGMGVMEATMVDMVDTMTEDTVDVEEVGITND